MLQCGGMAACGLQETCYIDVIRYHSACAGTVAPFKMPRSYLTILEVVSVWLSCIVAAATQQRQRLVTAV